MRPLRAQKAAGRSAIPLSKIGIAACVLGNSELAPYHSEDKEVDPIPEPQVSEKRLVDQAWTPSPMEEVDEGNVEKLVDQVATPTDKGADGESTKFKFLDGDVFHNRFRGGAGGGNELPPGEEYSDDEADSPPSEPVWWQKPARKRVLLSGIGLNALVQAPAVVSAGHNMANWMQNWDHIKLVWGYTEQNKRQINFKPVPVYLDQM